MFKPRAGSVLFAQYHGSHFSTQSCLEALARLVESSLVIQRVLLLTHEGRHGLLVEVDEPEPIFIRCGFTSGYVGEGPGGLALALHLLRFFKIPVEEVRVTSALLQRLDEAALTHADLHHVERCSVVRPIRIYDYMHDGLRERASAGTVPLRLLASKIPWSLLDPRLGDLALMMRSDSDRAVFEAFRRLEWTVKERCVMGSDVNGVQVFKKAFRGHGAILQWPGLSSSEVEGRAQLFEAAFMSYRNPRAHREVGGDSSRAYSEFSIINELYFLEGEAVGRDDTRKEVGAAMLG
ncbi:MAG TPA: TIGR02391 family protein [Luteimonas sp.]|nr:TIGR02391 family protein [Luteimonas sp.]